MSTFDGEAYRDAYEKMAAGDLDAISGHLAADYSLHLPGPGVRARGREQALALTQRALTRLEVTSMRIDRLDRHGDFVIACISGTSRARRGAFTGVDVLHIDAAGLVSEACVHRPPLPASAPAAAHDLEWEN